MTMFVVHGLEGVEIHNDHEPLTAVGRAVRLLESGPAQYAREPVAADLLGQLVVLSTQDADGRRRAEPASDRAQCSCGKAGNQGLTHRNCPSR
jgi:hypothetical protein